MTIEIMTAADLIRRGRALIAKHGWSPIDEGERLSIYSALGMILCGHRTIDMSEPDVDALAGPIAFVEAIISGDEPVFEWELKKGRTQAQVLDALEMAADNADRALDGEAA